MSSSSLLACKSRMFHCKIFDMLEYDENDETVNSGFISCEKLKIV